MLMIAATLPSILFAPWIGKIVDSVHPSTLIPLIVSITALLVGSLRLLYKPWQLAVVIAAIGLAAAVTTTALVSILPKLADRFSWSATRINAIYEVVRSGSYMLAPPIAAISVTRMGYHVTTTVTAVLYVCSGLIFIVLLRWLIPQVKAQRRRSFKVERKQPLYSGFRTLFSKPKIRTTMVVVSIAVAASAVFDVLLIFFIELELNLGINHYGTLLAMWSVGLILGPILTRFTSEDESIRITTRQALLWSLVHIVGFGLPALLPYPWLAYMSFLIGGAGNALQNTYLRVTVLTAFPNSQTRGSTLAAYLAVLQAGSVCGLFIAGLIPADYARLGMVLAAGFSITITIITLYGLKYFSFRDRSTHEAD